jgi:hypothetical protein
MQEVWVGRSASSFWGRGLLLQLGDGSYTRKQRYDFPYMTLLDFTKSWYQGISFEKLDELYALKVSPRHFQQMANETGVVEASQKGDSLHVE